MHDASRLYEFEFFDITGTAVADFSRLMSNKRYSIELNAPETLTFSMDLKNFEQECARIGENPQTVLGEYQTDVKVKRRNPTSGAMEYLMGTQVVHVGIDGGAQSETLSVTCSGYLDLFKDRYITKSYSRASDDSAHIARDMLLTTQAQPLGDVGVTAGNAYLTGTKRDQNYFRDNVKTQLVALAESEYGPFDFAFSAAREFFIYEKIGSRRDDLVFTWGTGGNIARYQIDRMGSHLHNRIIGLASGFGEDGLVIVKDDVLSQARYGLREKIVQFNSVTNLVTLEENTTSVLARTSVPLAIPLLTMRSDAFALAFPSIGDRVRVDLSAHPYLAAINGIYRIIKLDVSIDENDFEHVTVYFDDWGVDQGEDVL